MAKSFYKKNKNKKGDTFLQSKTLEIVLGVVGISFLIFLGVRLYFLIFPDPLAEAKSSLDFIYRTIIANVDNSNLEDLVLEIPNPSNWVIWGFNKDPFSILPCKDSDCICICETYQGCSQEKKGVCYPLEDLFELKKPFGPIKINKDIGAFIKISFEKEQETQILKITIEQKKNE